MQYEVMTTLEEAIESVAKLKQLKLILGDEFDQIIDDVPEISDQWDEFVSLIVED